MWKDDYTTTLKLLEVFEEGLLNEEDTLDLFQFMIDTGTMWEVSEKYTKLCLKLIDDGKLLPGLEKIPS